MCNICCLANKTRLSQRFIIGTNERTFSQLVMDRKHGLPYVWDNTGNLLTMFPTCEENDGLWELNWFPENARRVGRPAYTWDSRIQQFCMHNQLGNWRQRAQDTCYWVNQLDEFTSFTESWWTWNVFMLCCACRLPFWHAALTHSPPMKKIGWVWSSEQRKKIWWYSCPIGSECWCRISNRKFQYLRTILRHFFRSRNVSGEEANPSSYGYLAKIIALRSFAVSAVHNSKQIRQTGAEIWKGQMERGGRSLHLQLGTSQSQTGTTGTNHPSVAAALTARWSATLTHAVMTPFAATLPHQISTTLTPIPSTGANSWRKPRQTLLLPVEIPDLPKHTRALDFCPSCRSSASRLPVKQSEPQTEEKQTKIDVKKKGHKVCAGRLTTAMAKPTFLWALPFSHSVWWWRRFSGGWLCFCGASVVR